MKGINLLKEKNVDTVESIEVKKKVIKVSIVGFFVLLVLSFCVYFVAAGIRKQTEDIKALESEWTQKIKTYSDIESYALVIAQKIASVKKLKDEYDFYEIISNLNNSINPGVNIGSISLGNDGTLVLGGSADNSTSLIQFFNNLENNYREEVRVITLKSLAFSKEGQYQMSLSLRFKKK